MPDKVLFEVYPRFVQVSTKWVCYGRYRMTPAGKQYPAAAEFVFKAYGDCLANADRCPEIDCDDCRKSHSSAAAPAPAGYLIKESEITELELRFGKCWIFSKVRTRPALASTSEPCPYRITECSRHNCGECKEHIGRITSEAAAAERERVLDWIKHNCIVKMPPLGKDYYCLSCEAVESLREGGGA